MSGISENENFGDSSQQVSIPSFQVSPHGTSDNPSLHITTHKLNGLNFLRWSQFVKLLIHGKGKLGYLIGATKAPKKDDSGFQTWDLEHSMIRAWLVNSMELQIGQTYIFLPTAKELQEAVTETYSHLGNSTQIFELKSKIREIK